MSHYKLNAQVLAVLERTLTVDICCSGNFFTLHASYTIDLMVLECKKMCLHSLGLGMGSS